MTKRIFRSIFLVALAVLLASLTIVMGELYNYITKVQREQLRVQTELAAQGVAHEGMDYFDHLNTVNYRLTWVDSDGTVLYDSDVDAAAMENHATREEIQEAYSSGYGESSRNSETLMERQLYSAQLLPDGTVLRVSSTHYTWLNILVLMLPSLLLVIAVAVALSLLLASRLSKQIVKPLNSIDLDEPLASEAYEELAPFLIRIEQQHREINRQRFELKRKRDEFDAVTGSMNEGLVLLNNKFSILSINKSAAQLLCTDGSCVGKDMLTVNRSLTMHELLEKALVGSRAEKIMSFSSGEYQINASPIISDGDVIGVALLIFDVTEKISSEQLRREFSANVSHELKTPLHSILGCAEMIKNDIVKEEDIPQFIGQIYSEAQGLIALIDDIIRLSRLDEGVEDMPREMVDLLYIANDIAAQLACLAHEKGISMGVSGDHAEILGIVPVVRELVFNLCDNAIKYNREGGSVDIEVRDEGKSVALIVSDSGIGIPEKHQGRIFERFYRVDKSHSKESGGTGLGLSIVKHAAIIHKAEIDIQSVEGRGTKFVVRFPKTLNSH